MKRTISLVGAVLCGVAIGAVTAASTAHATPGPWSVAPFQLPADAPSGATYGLGRSHCAPAGPCVTPGSYYLSGSSGPFKAFMATVTNGVQTATDLPIADPAYPSQSFGKVACSASGACAAIGFNTNGKTGEPLLAVLTPSGWQLSVAPKPPGAAASKLQLSDVACGGAECYALGLYAPNTTHAKYVVERYTNSQWKVVVLPVPTGVTGQYGGGQTIACASATRCVVAMRNISLTSPIADVWNGTRWTTSILPLPSDAVASSNFGFTSACAPDGSCHVFGDYRTQISPSLARLVDWVRTGANWSTTALPKLAGTSGFGVGTMQCTAVDSCSTIVARYSAHGADRTVVATLSAGRWGLAYAPVPGQPQQFNYVELDVMACVPGAGCTGFGEAGNDARTPMETTVSSTPTSTAMPSPPSAAVNNYLTMSSAYYDGAEEVVFGSYLAPGGHEYLDAVWTRTI